MLLCFNLPSLSERSIHEFPSMAEGLIVGFGIPLLDISAKVDKEFLKKYNLGVNDSVQASASQHALYDDLAENYQVSYVAGGAAQNTIRVAQWILKTPKATTLFGCIGKDKFGDILQGKAEQEGVHVCYQRHNQLATGKCGVLITDHNRCLCADFAAAKAYSINHLQQEENWQHVKKAKVVYVTGYFLHSSPECVKLLAQSTTSHGQTFCLNLSAPYICREALDKILEILPYVDVLFGNEAEIKAFGKELKIKNNCITTQHMALEVGKLVERRRCQPCTVVITQSDKPTVVYQDSEIKDYSVKAVPPDSIVDTCGAGDAFVGGYLAEMVNGKEIPECIKSGHYAASKMIQCQGIQIPCGEPDFR